MYLLVCCLHASLYVLLMSITDIDTDTSSLFGLITCLLSGLNACLIERITNWLVCLVD